MHLVIQINATKAGVPVQLWNIDQLKDTQLTDATGKVTWDRAPTVHADYFGRVVNDIP